MRASLSSASNSLSFANNAYAGIWSCSNAFVTMVQATQLGDLDDLSDTRHRSWNWTLLVQPQMGPRSVVVNEIRCERSLEMPGVEDHEMIQAVSPYRADQAFGIRILPRTLRRGEQFLHVQR